MGRFFEHSKSFWVKYNEYAFVEEANGKRYLKAAPDAVPELYDPTDEFCSKDCSKK